MNAEAMRERERMWAEGMSAKRIAYEQGVTLSAILNYASEHRDRFPRRKSTAGCPRRYDHGKVLAMGRAGASAREIAEEVGCDVTTARKILRMGR